jgi:hypothetical protein
MCSVLLYELYHETGRLLPAVAGQMQRGLWPCEPYDFSLGFGRDTSELELYSGSDSECSNVDLLDTEYIGLGWMSAESGCFYANGG